MPTANHSGRGRGVRRIVSACRRLKARLIVGFGTLCFHAGRALRRSKAAVALSSVLKKARAAFAGAGRTLSGTLFRGVIFVYQLCRYAKGPLKRLLDRAGAVGCRARCMLAELRSELADSRRKNRVPVLAALLIVTVMTVTFSFVNVGLEVTVDGKVLGRIESQEEFEQLVRSVEDEASGYLGHPYVLDSDISYRFRVFDFREEVDTAEAARYLFSTIDSLQVAYVLRVDDQIVGANVSKTALELMLDRILGDYTPFYEGSTLRFVQDVSIVEEPVNVLYVHTVDEIQKYLTEPVTQSVNYTVQPGDTLSALALRFGTTVDHITAINPHVAPNTLSVGETLTTSKAVPFLSVEEVSRITYTEEIPFETVTEDNATMYKNQSKIVQKGQAGTLEIQAEVTMVDGVETGRTILSETVTAEPVTQIKQVGTLEPPPKSPTGSFIRPFGGRLTSNYGYRGREFHTGVDLAGPAGSGIIAADGGTVTFAGWNGGYGKCVIISHGGGVETLYAHCSSLSVKVGQKVGKGETIAAVGSTGRSTGPHCHFEVRVNGKHVSPWNYIG